MSEVTIDIPDEISWHPRFTDIPRHDLFKTSLSFAASIFQGVKYKILKMF